VKMRALTVASAVAVFTLVVPAGPAWASDTDQGKHLGQLGQTCTATYGFTSLGEAIHSIVSQEGNFAGGVPKGLATYC